MISIVVCTYNREEYLTKCLEHLRALDAKGASFEVIIIDNRSTDNTKEIVLGFINNNPNFPIRYHFESNPGLSIARNTGIEISKGDIIAFIDDDAFPRKDFVSNIEAFFSKNRDIHGYGGKIKPLMECETPNWMSHWLMPLMSVLDMGSSVKLFKNNSYPIGANMGFKRFAAERTGKFNTSLGRTGSNLLGGEEKDYFFRMRQLGFKIAYLPEVFVQHIVPESRLKTVFIKRQAFGIGQSERLRVSNKGLISMLSFLVWLFVKWSATFLISLYYLLTLQPAKAIMLVKFRFWVSKGFFSTR